MVIITGVVLFALLFTFAVAIGVISSRDEHEREERAGNANP